ncbi:WD40/YVTN/BNR-like repeat-containing protein [Arundinibacter roseus]|uniref:Photosynthesis system II assembly factor Ycf48/Hcf136-like domain-containing protein n=1 Tax=Arundinibacter roseus TaxID=2070510 RepID=A0A4V2XAH3_9BACT|nr:YCF48-related protein [Arundinibacter roseus]TDB67565.1 hypothetical protein EZE20_06380 [Arundinibacter roseus]
MKYILQLALFFYANFILQSLHAQSFHIEGPEIICYGTSATLTAADCLGKVHWCTGDSTATISISPKSMTQYSATCTDTEGQLLVTNHAVGVFPIPSFTSSTSELCSNNNVILRTNSTDNTHTFMSWKRDGQPIVSGNGAYFADQSGTYTVEDGTTPGVWVTYPEVPETGVLRKFSFIDDTIGWALTGKQELVKTTRGGKNWFKPTYTLNMTLADSLVDLVFTDETTGWTCTGSKIFKTSDSGVSWTIQYEDTTVFINDLFFLDNENGWAVGKFNTNGSSLYFESVLLSTTNGGASWQRIEPPSKFVIFNTIQFVTQSIGWGISNEYDYYTGQVFDGTLYKTTDGGNTWYPQIRNLFSGPLSCVHFKDINNGWLAGSFFMAYTKDGGNTWTSSFQINTSPFDQYIEYPKAINFVGEIGWILDQNRAYYTTNGGQSWVVSEYQSSSFYPSNVAFLPSGRVIATNETGNSVKFLPKAQSCISSIVIEPSPQPPLVLSSNSLMQAFCEGQIITLTGNRCDGTLRWSTGSTATSISVAASSHMSDYSVFCTSANGCTSTTHVKLGVLPKPILTTSISEPCNRPSLTATVESQWPVQWNLRWKRNGELINGQNSTEFMVKKSGTYSAEVEQTGVWGSQQPVKFNEYDLYHVQFISNETGFAVGITNLNEHILLSTFDGGENWYPQFLPLSNKYFTIHKFYFVNQTHGWIMGELVTEPNTTDILRTTDGGKNWQTTRLPTNFFTSLFFIDHLTGWIGGDYGKVWKTVDGGVTWTSQHSTLYQEIVQSIHFQDELRGWAGTSVGNMLSTDDGGASWTKLNSPNVSKFQSLQFTSAKHGWTIANEINGLFRTTDGGANWQRIIYDSTGQHLALDLDFVNDSIGFIRSYNLLFTTTNGGATWRRMAIPLNLNDMSFTDATHGWLVGSGIHTYRPVLSACISSGVEIFTSEIAPLRSISSGYWDIPEVWSCGTIPTAMDDVHISSGHIITLPQDFSAQAKSIDIQGEIEADLNSGIQIGKP